MLSSPAGTARQPVFGVGFADHAVDDDLLLGLVHVVVNTEV